MLGRMVAVDAGPGVMPISLVMQPLDILTASTQAHMTTMMLFPPSG